MKKEKILKLNDIKARNMLALLELLLQHDSLSRIELAHKMNCDNTTVTRAVRDLLERGLLISSGKTELRHGRPREQLTLNPDGKYVIGIALDPNGIIGTVTDLRGRVKVREQAFFQMQLTRSLFLETLENITRRLIRFADDKLAGVGVSTFGAGMESGTHLNDIANFPELNNLNLRDFFVAKFQIEPEFSDMMICRMYDELIRHPESRQGNTLMVSAGSGIGMAMAVDGKIIHGKERHGGELGHNICEPDGIPCACGRKGCLETRCSTDAILLEAQKAFRDPELTFPALAELYRNGDRKAEQLLDIPLRFLSVALANQINNLSPGYLILTGELTELGETFFHALEERIRTLLFPFASQGLKLICRGADEECGAVGAALLVTAKLMSDLDAFEKACPHL